MPVTRYVGSRPNARSIVSLRTDSWIRSTRTVDPCRDVDVGRPVVAFLEPNGRPRRRLLEDVDRVESSRVESGDDADDHGDQRDDDHDDAQRTRQQPLDEVHERDR